MDTERYFRVGNLENRGDIPVARDILACVREFQGSVYIEKEGRQITANSMVGILSLSIANGDIVKVSCFGGDEAATKLCFEKIENVICGVRVNDIH